MDDPMLYCCTGVSGSIPVWDEYVFGLQAVVPGQAVCVTNNVYLVCDNDFFLRIWFVVIRIHNNWHSCSIYKTVSEHLGTFEDASYF